MMHPTDPKEGSSATSTSALYTLGLGVVIVRENINFLDKVVGGQRWRTVRSIVSEEGIGQQTRLTYHYVGSGC